MGSLSSRPKVPQSAWKPHVTLQACFEELEDMISGGLSGKKVAGEFIFTQGDISASGVTICEALMNLKAKIKA